MNPPLARPYCYTQAGKLSLRTSHDMQAKLARYGFPPVHSTTIYSLPTELLLEIVSHIPERHPIEGHVLENKNLAALCQASKRLREAASPALYRDIVLTSEKQLRSLGDGAGGTKALSKTKSLSIYMSVDFLESFRSQAYQTKCTSRHPSVDYDPPTIYTILLSVLVHSPKLHTLRIRVAEISGLRSGWGKFATGMSQTGHDGSNLCCSFGVPVGGAITRSLDALKLSKSRSRSQKLAKLKSLRVVELDGFQDVEPLIKLAPNLEELRMNISGGYASYVNAELLWAIRWTPKLRRLSYTPTSLKLEDAILKECCGLSTEKSGLDESPLLEKSGLLCALGRVCPRLEDVDFDTRHFMGCGIEYRTRIPLIAPSSLSHHLSSLKCLQSLRLPCTMLSEEEEQAEREALIHQHHLPSTFMTFLTRIQEGVQSSDVEAEVIEKLRFQNTPLHTISFVRPVSTDVDTHSILAGQWPHEAVLYTVDSSSACGPFTSRVVGASSHQHSPNPLSSGLALPVKFVLGKWWREYILPNYSTAHWVMDTSEHYSTSGMITSYIKERMQSTMRSWLSPYQNDVWGLLRLAGFQAGTRLSNTSRP